MAGKPRTPYSDRRGRLAWWLRRLAVTAVVLCAAPAPSAWAAKKLAGHVDLQAFVADDFACAERVTVWILAPSADAFRGDRVRLQRLTGTVRAALDFQCDQVADIVLIGQVGRDPVWRGLVSEKNGWVLVDLGDFKDSPQQAEKPAPAPKPGNTAPAPAPGGDNLAGNQGTGAAAPAGTMQLITNDDRGPVSYGSAIEDEAILSVFP